MTIDAQLQKIYKADRDPTSNDYTIELEDGFSVVPNEGDFWNNTSNSGLWQCSSLDPGVSVSWDMKPTIESNTFTPELEFGGASTEITYDAQEGNYVKVGNAVTFNIYIVLTDKGSASGNARVTGLPFTNGSVPAAFTCYFQDCDHSLTYSTFGARISPSSDIIVLFESGTLLPVQNLTDDLFRNDTAFFISGTFFT